MCTAVFPEYVSVFHMCAVPLEARKRHQNPEAGVADGVGNQA